MYEILAWLFAVALFGVGDLATTTIGVNRAGLEERNPVLRRLLGPEPSLAGLGLVKIALFGIAYGGYLSLGDNPYRLLVPAGIAVVGFVVTVGNVLELWLR